MVLGKGSYPGIEPGDAGPAGGLKRLFVFRSRDPPVDAQIVIGSAAAFLAEVQRVLPDTATAKQKRRLA